MQRLNEASGEAGPAGLVAGAKAFTVVSVKIFVEVDVVPPVWIVLKFLGVTEDRALARSVAQENAG